MNKPMEGITVIELANYVAGPVVGRMLADMGPESSRLKAEAATHGGIHRLATHRQNGMKILCLTFLISVKDRSA